MKRAMVVAGTIFAALAVIGCLPQIPVPIQDIALTGAGESFTLPTNFLEVAVDLSGSPELQTFQQYFSVGFQTLTLKFDATNTGDEDRVVTIYGSETAGLQNASAVTGSGAVELARDVTIAAGASNQERSMDLSGAGKTFVENMLKESSPQFSVYLVADGSTAGLSFSNMTVSGVAMVGLRANGDSAEVVEIRLF